MINHTLLLPSRDVQSRRVNKICIYEILKNRGTRKKAQIKCYEKSEEEMTSSF